MSAGPGQHGLAERALRLHAAPMRLRPPFVLLDDAPDGAAVRLYEAPREIVRADTLDQVAPALARLRDAQRAGLHAAGYLSYEAGAALEPRVGTPGFAAPLLWFGLFERYETLGASDVAALLPDPAGAWAGTPVPRIAQTEYVAMFDRVQELIRAGDIYQANLTFRASVPVAGHPAALYALLRSRQRAGYGALVATGTHWLLSLSPELFFRLDGAQLSARPMKGTVRRGADPAADARAIETLRSDPKQRAENLMIVDLLRNDLSRVAIAGSVAVPELFTVETYPTVHTMTSRIVAEIAPEHDAVDAIEALFPCGSVTGAPKIRAMQVIVEVEPAPRNAYTGSIGRIDTDGDAAFNVAIRTLELADGASVATLGIGGGIVADSEVNSEWDECLAKASFVTAGERGFDLIETMAFDPSHGIALLDRHLARMGASARTFGFAFDRHLVRNELQAATFRLRAPSRVRLLLAPSGAIAIGITPLPERRAAPLRVAFGARQVAPDDFRLRHKTSRRRFLDGARTSSGTDEIIFIDADGFVTEGSYTSIFVERDGVLLTPPAARGLLPGVLRAELLETGRAVERDLRLDELAGGFLLGNALRGLMPAALAIAEAAPASL